MASQDDNSPISFEKGGWDAASDCSYIISVTPSASASSVTANHDLRLELLSTYEYNDVNIFDDVCRNVYYHFRLSGVITAAGREQLTNSIHYNIPAAARDSTVAFIFDLFEAGNYVDAGVMMKMRYMDYTYYEVDVDEYDYEDEDETEIEDLMFETLGVQDDRLTPARREAVEALEKVTIAAGDGEEQSCAVCLDEFSVGCEATKMPCSHVFHGDCIGKWLQSRFSCPLCRFQLPSE